MLIYVLNIQTICVTDYR